MIRADAQWNIGAAVFSGKSDIRPVLGDVYAGWLRRGGGCIYCSYSTRRVQVSSVWDLRGHVAAPILPMAPAEAQAGPGRGALPPLQPWA